MSAPVRRGTTRRPFIRHLVRVGSPPAAAESSWIEDIAASTDDSADLDRSRPAEDLASQCELGTAPSFSEALDASAVKQTSSRPKLNLESVFNETDFCAIADQ